MYIVIFPSLTGDGTRQEYGCDHVTVSYGLSGEMDKGTMTEKCAALCKALPAPSAGGNVWSSGVCKFLKQVSGAHACIHSVTPWLTAIRHSAEIRLPRAICHL